MTTGIIKSPVAYGFLGPRRPSTPALAPLHLLLLLDDWLLLDLLRVDLGEGRGGGDRESETVSAQPGRNTGLNLNVCPNLGTGRYVQKA